MFSDPAAYSAYYGPYGGGQSGAYRGYPQPQPSPLQYRRSRTAPARTTPRTANYQTAYARRTRGYSAEPHYFDQRYYSKSGRPIIAYRSYSGPRKNAKNMPMYRKKREPNSRIQTYQETEFGGAPVDSRSQYYPGVYSDTAPTLRRMRPYYAPSYSTYPPSIMNPSRTYRNNVEKRYPIALRVVIKIAEVILGAAVLGLVLGPMHDYSFYVFVTTTKTEWQGLVVGIVSCFAALALIMLATSCLAHEQLYWQKIMLDGTPFQRIALARSS
uniref:MARVEL domain-containing protein n=1 Tax=Ascaris lumbricoides TaxID=6252 RepID=A0A0M3IT61_ASCLU